MISYFNKKNKKKTYALMRWTFILFSSLSAVFYADSRSDQAVLAALYRKGSFLTRSSETVLFQKIKRNEMSHYMSPLKHFSFAHQKSVPFACVLQSFSSCPDES